MDKLYRFQKIEYVYPLKKKFFGSKISLENILNTIILNKIKIKSF